VHISKSEMITPAEFWHELASRPDGPMAFRFYLQPAMATLFAIRDGVHDARDGRPAYFWNLFTDRAHAREHLRHGWLAVRRVFLFALALDVIYQLTVLKTIRPLEGLVVAFALALVPYVALRGPANRIARLVSHRSQNSRAR
jgi:hypothetical protein